MSTLIIEQIKRDLVARGVSLVGSCGAAAITVRAGWALRADGWGYMKKRPPQNHCDVAGIGPIGVDVLMTKQGHWVDILVSSGGSTRPDGSFDPGNGPSWQFHDGSDGHGLANPADWIAPVNVDLVPDKPPIEAPPSADYTALVKRLGAMQEQIDGQEADLEALEARLDAVEDRPPSGPILPGQVLAELLAFQAALSVVIDRISRLMQVIPR